MFCENCGKEIKDENKFCPYCGECETFSVNNVLEGLLW